MPGQFAIDVYQLRHDFDLPIGRRLVDPTKAGSAGARPVGIEVADASAIAADSLSQSDAGSRLTNYRFGSRTAVQASSADRPVYPPLPTFCYAAANRGFGPENEPATAGARFARSRGLGKD
jgi:hypothetical protein